MIRYALNCEQGHTFESWFANSAAYDKQVKRGLITCPVCGSVKVEKAIMAPRLTRGDAAAPPSPTPPNPAPQPPLDPAPRPWMPPKWPRGMMSSDWGELRHKLKGQRGRTTR